MGYKYKNDQEDIPGYGAIFMSNTGTKKECFQRKLLGLPLAQSNFVLNVKKGMILFLFEFERRQLHGVFRATSNGEIDIEPNAFRSSGKQFPAQVRFTPVWNCKPLAEDEFQDAIIDNYFSGKKFKFGLSKDQVYKLVTLFHSKRIPKTHPVPERSLRQYDDDDDDDKEAERDSRCGDNRRSIRDRLRFVKQEDEFKEIDVKGYRSFRDERALKDNNNREGFSISTNCLTLTQSDGGTTRQLEKHFNHDNMIQDEYHIINGYGQSISSHNLGTPDKRSQMLDNAGGYYGHDTVERTLTKRTADVWVNSSYEPRTLSIEHPPLPYDYEPRGTDISHFNQNSSDFIPIPEVTEQYPHPFEFDNIGNTYGCGFPYSATCDPSMITLDTPYDPEVPEFCHKPSSYFAPGPPMDNQPIPYHSENKHSDVGEFRSNYVRKVSVFDRLTSAPKAALKKEQEAEKDDLDASVDKVMKMLEKIASSPIKRTGKRQSAFRRQPIFKQDDDDDDDDSETVDYDEFPNIEEYEGIESESVVEETRVVDFKRRNKRSKNLDDESKEAGTESDVGKRRKLVRPVFVKKESTVEGDSDDAHNKQPTCDESAPPLEGDCSLTKAVESLENIEDQKSSTKGEVCCSQVEETGNAEICKVLKEEQPPPEKHESDDIAQVESSKDNSKTCGWIDG